MKKIFEKEIKFLLGRLLKFSDQMKLP